MVRSFIVFVITALFVLVSYSPLICQVVIYEIAWMGTDASSYDEWIELYNTSNSAIDLTGWVLSATDGTPNISLEGTINPNSYFLLERVDDNTISDIQADQIYSGALENAGEHLELRDDSNQLIDEVNCASGWFAGTNSPRNSMEKISPALDGNAEASWGTNDGVTRNGLDANSQPINGTPKAQNSVYDSSLPVELSSFTAYFNNSFVLLKWTTQSELNNQGFYVLRAPSEDGVYVKISPLIPGAGTSSERHDYTFRDRNVVGEQEYWYKIRQVDFDGATKVYGPIKAAIRQTDENPGESALPAESKLLGNYPNPFNPGTVISFVVGGDEDTPVSVMIYDLLGRKVKQILNGTVRPGLYELSWNGTDDSGQPVSGGLYFCRMICGERVSSLKLLKVE